MFCAGEAQGKHVLCAGGGICVAHGPKRARSTAGRSQRRLLTTRPHSSARARRRGSSLVRWVAQFPVTRWPFSARDLVAFDDNSPASPCRASASTFRALPCVARPPRSCHPPHASSLAPTLTVQRQRPHARACTEPPRPARSARSPVSVCVLVPARRPARAIGQLGTQEGQVDAPLDGPPMRTTPLVAILVCGAWVRGGVGAERGGRRCDRAGRVGGMNVRGGASCPWLIWRGQQKQQVAQRAGGGEQR